MIQYIDIVYIMLYDYMIYLCMYVYMINYILPAHDLGWSGHTLKKPIPMSW
jgi:hypothetical protein